MPPALRNSFCGFAAVCLLLVAAALHAQQPSDISAPSPAIFPDAPSSTLNAELTQDQQKPQEPPEPEPNPSLGESGKPQQNNPSTPEVKKQPKRILWVIPNYRAVSSDADVPPLDNKGKFKLMIDDSFDYSAFVYTGFVAGLRMAAASYPEFGEGPTAYGRYYYHFFIDQAVGNAFTEWLLPVATKQDPRYFTKGHGSFLSRTGYAASRLVITRSDKGTSQFNISEIAGNLAAAGISNAYYPAPERGVNNTINNWVVQLGLDGGFNIIKEFWPDISHKIFHID